VFSSSLDFSVVPGEGRPHKAPAPNRRRPFPLGDLGEFAYVFLRPNFLPVGSR
jgi:hypothetical protein